MKKKTWVFNLKKLLNLLKKNEIYYNIENPLHDKLATALTLKSWVSIYSAYARNSFDTFRAFEALDVLARFSFLSNHAGQTYPAVKARVSVLAPCSLREVTRSRGNVTKGHV